MGISLVAKEMQAIMSAWKLLRCCMRCVTALYLIAKHPRAFTQQPPPASSKSRLIRRAAVTINTSNLHHFIRRLMSCSCADLRVAVRDMFQGCKAQERSGMQRLPRHCHVLRAVLETRAKSTCLPTFQHFTLTSILPRILLVFFRH
jgi:hypothetical protein